MSNDEQERDAAQAMAGELAMAVKAVTQLPPLVWAGVTTCASCQVNPTYAYKHMADGSNVPICGLCRVKEIERVIEDGRRA